MELKLIVVALVLCFALFAQATPSKWLKEWQKQNPAWRGLHLGCQSDAEAKIIIDRLPGLSKMGVNALIVEVNYGLQFKSHPELKPQGGLTREMAQKLADDCRKVGIRPIPMINCLGHQSWAEATNQLLTTYPEFDETPGKYLGNKGIYCRSWCPQHPGVNKLVFELIDELVEVFQADAFHVGMDEVFIIGSEFCERCKGQDPAKLFALAVNDFHKHIVKKRKLEMMIWGDRLLNGTDTGYGEWEASMNKTEGAIDLIPKDIIVCDWHYETMKAYPSVQLFVDKGFRVLPSPWKDVKALEAFLNVGYGLKNKKVLGHLSTTLGAVATAELETWEPLQKALEISKKAIPGLP